MKVNNTIKQDMTEKTSERPKMVNISAHIPLELAQRLERVSKLEERTKSYYVKKSLEEYLEDVEDYLAATKCYQEYVANGRQGASIEDVARKCGIDLKTL